MKQQYLIKNSLGLHVMPSKRIALAAEAFECDMQLWLGDKCGNPKKMIEIVKLGVKGGATVTLETKGVDEQEAQRVVGELLSQG